MEESRLELTGQLSAVVHRADGTTEDLGVISGPQPVQNPSLYSKPLTFWEKVWENLKREGKIPASMGLGAFAGWVVGQYLGCHDAGVGMAIVTTAGVNYMAADFASGGASPRISSMNFQDSGTGTLQGTTNNLASPFASNATPIVITETAHGRTTNDIVQIAGVTTNTAANGIWQILVLTANTYSLYGSVGNGVAGGTPTAQRVNGAADTALTTATGISRVAGTQSNPSANVYRSVATISYNASFSITEWGIFSASTSGTLLDRRWFNSQGSPAITATAALTSSPIGVNNLDAISFTYSLSLSSGGS